MFEVVDRLQMGPGQQFCCEIILSWHCNYVRCGAGPKSAAHRILPVWSALGSRYRNLLHQCGAHSGIDMKSFCS